MVQPDHIQLLFQYNQITQYLKILLINTSKRSYTYDGDYIYRNKSRSSFSLYNAN